MATDTSGHRQDRQSLPFQETGKNKLMIIQCDFDGTIITNNMSLLLRERFAPGDWRKIESDYLARRLTVEESNKRQFTQIKEPREKLEAFARDHAEVRTGFLDFTHYCLEDGIRLVIVSSGLDFYIEAILNRIGAPRLEVHCAQTSFGQDGVTVSYVDPRGNTVKDGFKKQHLVRLKRQGEPVTYIGDGLSDLEPACAADSVFTTGQLPGLLSAKSVSHRTFSDFHNILRQIDEERNGI